MPMFPGMGIVFAVLLIIAPLWIVSELKEVRKVNERILKKLQEK
jgi:Na+-transporting methylmalonyl-CoA/oxaloacetate decarboxylase gamma subunit